MGNDGAVGPDEISLAEFQDALSRYPAVIKSISDSKPKKAGQKTLEALDEYRYVQAPSQFGPGRPTSKPMGLEDVKTLVEWKLRHGKFRPTLMKLVSSNDGAAARSTIQRAVAAHRAEPDVLASSALAVLAELRGVGPATASLLLAVHDPDRVVFFGDEVFHWLCAAPPAKYSAGEYRMLHERAGELAARLAVTAADIERVAFVLVRDHGAAPAAKKAAARGSSESTKRAKAGGVDDVGSVSRPPSKKPKKVDDDTGDDDDDDDEAKPQPRSKARTKRKQAPSEKTAGPLRRSKRRKSS